MGVFKKIKHLCTGLPGLAVLLLIILILLNIGHLVWYIIKPEGFWSFYLFLRTFLIVTLGLVIVLFIVFFIILGIVDLFNNFTLNKLLKGIGIIAILLLTQTVNFFQINYLELKFYTFMANKYKYLKKSERLVSNAQFEEALKYAQKSRSSANIGNAPWPIFFLTKYYQSTELARLKDLDEQFAVNINYAYCLNKIDSLQNKAIQEYRNIIALTNTPLLSQRKDYKIFPLTALIDIYLKTRQYDKADSCNTELMSYMRFADKNDITYFLECQEEMADYALITGDEKTSANICINNLRIYEDAGLSKKSSEYLYHLTAAASANITLNNIEKAGDLLIEATPLAKKKKNNEVYLSYLLIKARYCETVSYLNNGNKDLLDRGWLKAALSLFTHPDPEHDQFKSLAGECYETILNKIENKYGTGSLECENARFLLANYQLKVGNYSESEKLYQEIATNLNTTSKVSEDFKNRLYIMSLFSRSLQGKPVTDLAELGKIEDAIYNEAVSRLIYLNEYERDLYANQIQQQLQIVNAILIKINTPEANTHLYNNILASKNMVLYTNRYQRSLLNDSTLKIAYLQLLQEKDRSTDGLETLIKEKNFLHRLRSSPDFNTYNPRNITWQEIKMGLSKGDVAIEYLTSYNIADTGKFNTYYALVLQSDFPWPKLIKICKDQDINKLTQNREDIFSQINSTYVRSLQEMKNLLIEPILQNTVAASHLYISPSGNLHQISFPALLEGSNISYTITGSTRLLSEHATPALSGQKAILFGDIDYNNVKNSGKHFDRLTYTAGEVARIGKILNTHHLKSEIISGNNATEAYVRSLSGGRHSIIHIATHGYYEKDATPTENLLSDRLNINQSVTNMQKCNLVFAGVNSWKSNDGIVSAQDIANMDLSGTDLVVLSACETGLGQINGFEGVQGFQRAFSLAGVNNVMVTLWKISDKYTSEIMGYFYENLANGTPAPQALIMAQRKMKLLYGNPYYWAGFVIINR